MIHVVKPIALLLATIMTVNAPVTCLAANSCIDIKSECVTEIKETSSYDGEEKSEESSEKVTDLNGNEFPSQYSSLDKGIITPDLVGQGIMNTCLTFACISLIETAILRHGYTVNGLTVDKDTLDLSELYLAELAKYEGNTSKIVEALTRWDGPILEEQAPYHGKEMKYDGYTEEDIKAFQGQSVAHVDTILRINTSVLSEDKRMESVNKIKSYVMKYGSVECDIEAYSECWNADYSAYYADYVSEEFGFGHAINIIGWDDNYPKENFKEGHQPPYDGAWYTKNSAGTGDGLKWVSYYSKTTTDCTVIDVSDPNEYDHNYNHDYEEKSFEAPAIFTQDNKEGKTEYLKAVCLSTDSTETIQIYKNLKDSTDPYSGTLVEEATTQFTPQIPSKYYAICYETVELAAPVQLKRGDTFAIVTTSGLRGREVRGFAKSSDEDCSDIITSVEEKVTISENMSSYTLHPVIQEDKHTIQYRSSNEDVVKVSSNGVLTPIAGGEADITISTSNSERNCHVTVRRNIADAVMEVEDAVYDSSSHIQPFVLKMNGITLPKFERISYTNSIKPGTVTITVSVDEYEENYKYYTGTKTGTYQIKKSNINDLRIYPTDELVYNPFGNSYTRTRNGQCVIPINEKYVSYLNGTIDVNAVGERTLTLTIAENPYYYGTKVCKTTIHPLEIDEEDIITSFSQIKNAGSGIFSNGSIEKDLSGYPYFYYTGKEVKPVIDVELSINGNTICIPQSSYSTAYSNNINSCTYTMPWYTDISKAVITLSGNYAGYKDVYFHIKNEINPETTIEKGTTIGAVETVVSYNEEMTVHPTVSKNGVTLEEGTDYTVDCSSTNFGAAGTGYGKIIGTGVYTGEKSFPITIKERSLSSNGVSFTPKQEISKEWFDVLEEETLNGITSYYYGTLTVDGKNFSDYQNYPHELPILFLESKIGNTYNCILKAVNPSDFEGEIPVTFTVAEDPQPVPQLININNATVEISDLDARYKEIPVPSVKYGNETLQKDTDYTYTVTGINSDADWKEGTEVTYTFTGKGAYTGNKTVIKTVIDTTPAPEPEPVPEPELIDFAGTEIEIGDLDVRYKVVAVPVVTYDGNKLQEGIDYNYIVTGLEEDADWVSGNEVSYIFTGIGSYEGTKTVQKKVIDTTPKPVEPEPEPEPEPVPDPKINYITVVKSEKYELPYETGMKYTNSNKKIATVNKKGVVTAVRPGTTTITASIGETSVDYVITVETPVFPEKKYFVNVGKTVDAKITETELPATYRFNKEGFATVDADGNITGVKKGSVTLMATIHGKTYKVPVVVDNPAISLTEKTLNRGQSFTLKMTNRKGKVEWSSLDEAIVTVNKNGKIKAMAEGNTVITATVNRQEYTCQVRVDNPVLSDTKITLKVGEAKQLTISGVAGEVQWMGSNKNVTVQPDGMVTALKKGSGTAWIKVNGKKFKCKIKIVK